MSSLAMAPPLPAAFTPSKISKGMPKLSGKNQVTIPVAVLREVGIDQGDSLLVRAAGKGKIEVERAADLIERFAGSLPPLTYPPGYLDDLRDEWDR